MELLAAAGMLGQSESASNESGSQVQKRQEDASPPEQHLTSADDHSNSGSGFQLSGSEELTLSPSLLAELDYTPMRITRSMASIRSAFSRSIGISAEGLTLKGGEQENNCSASVVSRKTGKRSLARGVRSGWSKSSIIDQAVKIEDSVKVMIRKPAGKSKTMRKSTNRGGGKKKNGSSSLSFEKIKNGKTNGADQNGEDVSSGVTEGETTNVNKKIEVVSVKVKSSPVGWVMCDDCGKWRCISSALADSIEASDIKWTCRENPNKKYSDCSVPQEKTNAEINAELNISDISTSEGDIDAAVNSKSRASWTQIRHNIFQHRRPKKLDDDDTLICHCKPPKEGHGCGDDCLNRMMNVECAPDNCPCGERCSNQQFGKRMYANIALVRCGKKGFGLRALEHVPKGSFIIEYVGEVLDVRAFELRQKEYARERQKHFYFMTLNSSEVIDACRKGNLGRFINHSCDPNCQTEKWCVNGEICIGLFAIRDVKKNEEITFNYNFERLFGAAAKKCHCGSSHCHGYIGGDPSNPTDVVQTDSEEDMEPIMLKDGSEDEEDIVDTETVQEKVCTEPEALPWEPEPKPVPVIVPKPKPVVTRIKRGKSSGRPKKVSSKGFKSIRRSHCSEVEEKLDKLLNEQGGLVKKKDTPNQYLKLLVISTASGDDSSEGTSCSMRDLSLLLDAMLKTASRTILNEVIQKNGLQLLHNMVKQSRKTFTKIPILRKLLKVLELLAEKKVIKTEHMTIAPPRNGMESFVKSMFELTRHEDLEVQHISRRFQKNWLPNMFDLLANDIASGNQFVHKHWGPDRFSQKRELFQSTKPEERHRKPFFRQSENPKDEDDRRHSEQESKRRRRGSRWDELPCGTPTRQDFQESDSNEPPGYSSSINSRAMQDRSHRTINSSSSSCRTEQQDKLPGSSNDNLRAEQDRFPGSSNGSSNNFRAEQDRFRAAEGSSHRAAEQDRSSNNVYRADHFQRQQQQQQSDQQQHWNNNQTPKDHNWNRPPPFRPPPYRPYPNGQQQQQQQPSCYMGRQYQQQPSQIPYSHKHLDSLPPPYHLQQQQDHHFHNEQTPAKYHQQQQQRPMNGCFNSNGGVPSQAASIVAGPSQFRGFYSHPPVDEEPPVPGL